MDRQPCPYRIYDDFGSAFTMGCVGGGLFHLFKGAKNAPQGEKIEGAIRAIKYRAPILGGNFAIWGGLFSCIDCCLIHYRQKEDSLNAIAAGFLTGGLVAIRGGFKQSLNSAIIGALILVFIEGAGHLVNQNMTKMQIQSQSAPPPPQFGRPVVTRDFRKRELDFIPSESLLDQQHATNGVKFL